MAATGARSDGSIVRGGPSTAADGAVARASSRAGHRLVQLLIAATAAPLVVYTALTVPALSGTPGGERMKFR